MSREYVLMQTFTAGQTFTNPSPDADSGRLGDLYKFVKLNAAGHVVLCSADTDVGIGTLQYCAPEGEPVQVAIGGVSLVQVAGAVVAPNSKLSPDASGRAAASASGDRPLGMLLEPITAADDEAAAQILITPGLDLLP